MLGRNGRAFDQRQQVTLHAFAGYVSGPRAVAHADLVDFIEEDDSVVLDGLHGFLRDLLAVEQLVALFIDKDLVGVGDRQAARLGAPAHLAENIADVDCADLRAGHARNFEHRRAA